MEGGMPNWGGSQVGFLLLGAPPCCSPPSPTYIYIGRGRLEHKTSSVSRVRRPPPQNTPSVIFSRCLSEALRGSLQNHRHHAVVLTKLSLDTLLDQEFEGRHRAERVLNSEVSYVRYLIGQNEKKFDYINRINKCFRFRSTMVRVHTLESETIPRWFW